MNSKSTSGNVLNAKVKGILPSETWVSALSEFSSGSTTPCLGLSLDSKHSNWTGFFPIGVLVCGDSLGFGFSFLSYPTSTFRTTEVGLLDLLGTFGIGFLTDGCFSRTLHEQTTWFWSPTLRFSYPLVKGGCTNFKEEPAFWNTRNTRNTLDLK
jgi:hypothetical protein